MASETNFNSSLVKGISKNTSILKLTRKNYLIVYKYYHIPPKGKERDKKGKILYYYNFYDYKANATINFQNHYHKNHGTLIQTNTKEHHTEIVADSFKAIINKLRNENPEFQHEILKDTLNQQILEKALLDLIIIQNLPF